MKQYQENMTKWRKLFNNQMIYYVKNILSVTYSNINSNYIISIHESGNHKLYVVLRDNKGFTENDDEDRSSILNFSEVTNNEPSEPINTKYNHKQPLLTGGDYTSDRYQSV